jgi:hypothetical protein
MPRPNWLADTYNQDSDTPAPSTPTLQQFLWFGIGVHSSFEDEDDDENEDD